MAPNTSQIHLPAIAILAISLFLAAPIEAAKIKVGGDPTLGDQEAKLVLLEFGDFQ